MIITHTLEDTTIENALKTFEDFYLKKDYPNAILTLEKNQHEINAGLWHYNMGIALGQMNNWPMARFHFILAEASGVHSQELFQNLKLVEDKLDTGRLEQPLNTSDYIIKTGIIASDGPLLSLGFLFLVVGLWFLKKKPSLKSAVFFVLAVASPLMLDLWIDSWTPKIVITKTQTYEGPSALFAVKDELPQGLMVMTNTKGEWEKIIFPSRFSGWIKSDGLKRLELK